MPAATWTSSHRQMGVAEEEAIRRLSPAGGIYFRLDEADVQRILKFDQTMIGSDGLPHDAAPHPRLWGSFPRVLGHYGRLLGLFPLETAIYKMTGLTAKNFGLKDRGVLKEGAYADLALFDADTVGEAATYEAPDCTGPWHRGGDRQWRDRVARWRVDGSAAGAGAGARSAADGGSLNHLDALVALSPRSFTSRLLRWRPPSMHGPEHRQRQRDDRNAAKRPNRSGDYFNAEISRLLMSLERRMLRLIPSSLAACT